MIAECTRTCAAQPRQPHLFMIESLRCTMSGAITTGNDVFRIRGMKKAMFRVSRDVNCAPLSLRLGWHDSGSVFVATLSWRNMFLIKGKKGFFKKHKSVYKLFHLTSACSEKSDMKCFNGTGTWLKFKPNPSWAWNWNMKMSERDGVLHLLSIHSTKPSSSPSKLHSNNRNLGQDTTSIGFPSRKRPRLHNRERKITIKEMNFYGFLRLRQWNDGFMNEFPVPLSPRSPHLARICFSFKRLRCTFSSRFTTSQLQP